MHFLTFPCLVTLTAYEWSVFLDWKPFNKVHAKDAPKLALALQDFQFCHLGGKQFHHPYHCTKLAFIVTQLWKQISSLEDASQLV
ncbi:hypothetical protein P691DRAFT_769909 [Macrolepiota fuliginosa MF-IS2]|uniref:Uncharacterized protein n=1 Tax=Macrolepiota fuliginosa MF-IS2 TaxID=1400762 RepID=A0A9P5WX51_9AGAR|nr:hypothetical protein P691DRAFT_769909 [Macrolepiota fuliginosa MF-IS2]